MRRCDLCRRGDHVWCWDTLEDQRTARKIGDRCCCGAWSVADVPKPERLSTILARVLGAIPRAGR